MADAPAGADGVLIKATQAGCGLARVGDGSARALDGTNKTTRERRDPAHSPQEVERCAFRGKDSAQETRDFRHHSASLDLRPLSAARMPADSGVGGGKNGSSHVETADDPLLLRADLGRAALTLGNEGQ